MALIHYEQHQIDLKIVYCGPPGAGKTSCLRYLHRELVPPPTADIVTLRTGTDRTLYFEVTLPDLSLIEGFETRFQVFTVPGTVELNVPHQLVLRDVDAIVFVADSRWSAIDDTLQSLSKLEANLARHHATLDSVPVVIQFNKRELPDVAPVNYLEFLLNRRSVRMPSFESSTVTGDGVLKALDTAIHLAVRQFKEEKQENFSSKQLGLEVD